MRHYFLKIIATLCLFLLAGCSAPAEEKAQAEPETKAEKLPVVQELTAVELQQYFEKAYKSKGNYLNTPEQLALEVAELETLTADAVLPEDYEAQYQTWRSEKVTNVLEEIQASYQEILEGLSQYSYPIPGACYADYVDFEGDGCPELLVVSLEEIPDYTGDGGLQPVLEVYASKQGEIKKIGEEHSYSWAYDSVGQCEGGQETFINISHNDAKGDSGLLEYYGVKDGRFKLLDQISYFNTTWDLGEESESIYDYTSFDKAISTEEYESIRSKYSETQFFISFYYTMPTVESRGILPEPSPDLSRRAAMIETLDNSNAEYVCLADMDGDGVEDLVTLENYSFHTYIWDGTTVHAVDLSQRGGEVYGIYKEKSTGKIYVAYEDPIVTAYYFERVSEVVTIDEDTYSFDGCYAEIEDRFEKIVGNDTLWENYATVESVRDQLLSAG